jgi:hypothetical protein
MSNQLILPSLKIQGFRVFRKLEIGRLGRVNLIVGKNNVGKTSILEALRLYANPSPRALLELISTRDEFDQPQGPRPNGRRRSSVPIEALFHRGPADPDRTRLISIGPIGEQGRTLEFGLTEGKPQGTRPRGSSSEDIDGDLPLGTIALSRRIGSRPARVLSIDDLPRLARDEHIMTPETEDLDAETLLSVYVKSDGLDPRSTVMYWQRVNLTEYHSILTDSLRLIEPRIVQSSANVPSPDKLVPIVRLEGAPEPVTLRSMGGGMVHLFHLGLALAHCAQWAGHGVLLVDEIENGLHYSIHEDLWKFVFKLARDLNVQVFATTHSWDCIEAFQRAACEDVSSEGYLLRLGWRRDEVVATVYDENDLAVVTRDHIDVR